jgi:hypothetical protein
MDSQAPSFALVPENRQKHCVIGTRPKYQTAIDSALRHVTAETFYETAAATRHTKSDARSDPYARGAEMLAKSRGHDVRISDFATAELMPWRKFFNLESLHQWGQTPVRDIIRV